ncbi:Protein-tyrosine phosphatase, receptor/non-receptor type domain and Protein-tyrosine/Dual specificity phosphatase domain and Protein-tyrosine phosphatase, catalytic domain-containing protein [Strongyloides ratti]|uniref:Protein-tyrosine phosphatase, receptor/non-receptor type domain and Protein-tyrosine/Dual specificity phosphatase domain and Protein-tyrosine phosphatase, catalytic domain-containing protein n=1 Tax=Strongyloides ratti TaxID=34506 RepID=A0A090MYQ3_STRRB|nr:Protein-tyrosine phosphatase, receptor/non-receptor type domain and Protein-tyrosine/Dual specificity phosphatase domain and Protein-tyrosine phosphatase, catalytic domain-containing protein [Strongyloides ratti]CEF67584.1 Protein-tyrosine phosphatase, receptor/non-receptor type domain and Protein-tyrosine/Dual specificity phosphatase domain and Protein-tyrosine phosphatase, catalytic domain-containing protein [Strongyloides ratti]
MQKRVGSILIFIFIQIGFQLSLDTILFPTLLNNILFNKSFPLNYDGRNNEIVLIKCPSEKFKYANIENLFIPSIMPSNVIKITANKLEKVVWYGVFHNNKSELYSIINCGIIKINYLHLNITTNWLVKINWDISNNKTTSVIPFDTTTLPTNACNTTINKTIIYKTYNGILKDKPYNISESYKNQLVYVFILNDNNTIDEILFPCQIYKPVYYKPNITLIGIIPSKVVNNIFIVTKEYENKAYFPILTSTSEKPYFYINEKINVSEVEYTMNDDYKENSNKIVNDTINLHGYGIFKFTYYCDDCINKNDTVTIKKIFFGPNKDNIILKNESIVVNKDKNLKFQANCGINTYTFAYLEKVSFNSKTIYMKNISQYLTLNDNEFLLDSSKIYLNISYPNGIFKCHYKTPTYTILEIDEFLLKSDIIPKKNFTIEVNKTQEINVNKPSKNKTKILKLNLKKQKFKTIPFFPDLLIVILIFTILFIGIYTYNKKTLIFQFFYNIKMKRKHPNIHIWWNRYKTFSIYDSEDYISEEEYLNYEYQNFEKIKFNIGGETVQRPFPIKLPLKGTNFKNKLLKNLMAKKVTEKSFDREYIVSYYPFNEKYNEFWNMLYDENINVIISVTYNNKKTGKRNVIPYWLSKKNIYGNLKVERFNKKEIISQKIDLLQFNITKLNEITKTLTIIDIFNWEEYSILKCDIDIYEIYNEVIQIDDTSKILLHSQLAPYTTIVEPQLIINDIIKSYNIGYIDIISFNSITNSLTKYFFNKNILNDNDGYTIYKKNYEQYIENIKLKETSMNASLRPFLNFTNYLNLGKMNYILRQLENICNYDINTLKKVCSRFYEIQNNLQLSLKINYKNIPCLDGNCINFNSNYFVHGNILEYCTKNLKKRKIIMCQIPNKETKLDMINMIINYKVSTIVMLVNNEEIILNNLVNYLPNNINTVYFYGIYRIQKLNDSKESTSEISISTYSIQGNDEKSHIITYIQLKCWSNNEVIKNHNIILKLYNIILRNINENPVIFQCCGGIGKSGTLALIFYIIDNLNQFNSFDPLFYLNIIRQIRYLSIPGIDQFMLVLSVVYENFKNDIKKYNPELYDKFFKIRDIILNNGLQYL